MKEEICQKLRLSKLRLSRLSLTQKKKNYPSHSYRGTPLHHNIHIYTIMRKRDFQELRRRTSTKMIRIKNILDSRSSFTWIIYNEGQTGYSNVRRTVLTNIWALKLGLVLNLLYLMILKWDPSPLYRRVIIDIIREI